MKKWILFIGLLIASYGVEAQSTFFSHCWSSVKGVNNWTSCKDVYHRYNVRWRENTKTGKVTTWISIDSVDWDRGEWIEIEDIDLLKRFFENLPDPVMIGNEFGNNENRP